MAKQKLNLGETKRFLHATGFSILLSVTVVQSEFQEFYTYSTNTSTFYQLIKKYSGSFPKEGAYVLELSDAAGESIDNDPGPFNYIVINPVGYFIRHNNDNPPLSDGRVSTLSGPFSQIKSELIALSIDFSCFALEAINSGSFKGAFLIIEPSDPLVISELKSILEKYSFII